ncbi:hypothetical protein OS493_008404 [Desmophyllum pertusum]|uniref:Uncharacterized protein n=1 Tax=Desmophyllum pertusum TaxID=174260 RepID=A0A9X0DAT7_9CNID|nr:hypothetical protein OS493_008404 [Desmophyllum pertusum]
MADEHDRQVSVAINDVQVTVDAGLEMGSVTQHPLSNGEIAQKEQDESERQNDGLFGIYRLANVNKGFDVEEEVLHGYVRFYPNETEPRTNMERYIDQQERRIQTQVAMADYHSSTLAYPSFPFTADHTPPVHRLNNAM